MERLTLNQNRKKIQIRFNLPLKVTITTKPTTKTGQNILTSDFKTLPLCQQIKQRCDAALAQGSSLWRQKAQAGAQTRRS